MGEHSHRWTAPTEDFATKRTTDRQQSAKEQFQYRRNNPHTDGHSHWWTPPPGDFVARKATDRQIGQSTDKANTIYELLSKTDGTDYGLGSRTKIAV